MKQPTKTRRPDNENGTSLVIGTMLLALITLEMCVGCEHEIALQSDLAPQATTMPAIKDLNIEELARKTREEFRMELHDFQVQMGFLSHDFVMWWWRCTKADARLMSAMRRDDKTEIEEYTRKRKELAEVGRLLDHKMFVLRMRLSDLRMDAVAVNADWPNLLLLKEGK